MLFIISIVLITVLAFVLYHGRTRIQDGIPYSVTTYKPWFGVIFAMQENLTRIADWKSEMIYQVVEVEKQKTIAKLKAAGQPVDLKKINGPEMVQFGFPFSAPFVEILSPRNAKWILIDKMDWFVKGDATQDAFREFLGDGIFVADGESWREQRKVASHMFTYSKLTDYMFETFSRDCERVMEYLHTVAASGEEIDFQQLSNDFTLASIASIACGVEINNIGQKTPHPAGFAFDAIGTNVATRLFTPAPLWKLKRRFQLGTEKEVTQHFNTIDAFVQKVIDERRLNLADWEESGDLLSMFMIDAKKKGETVSDARMKELITNFVSAGRDTTAAAITWLFYNLSQQPEALAKCVAEIQSNLDPNVVPTAEAIKSLTYLEATFMESLRWHTSVPSDFRVAAVDSTFPSGEFIPAGTFVGFSPYLTNLHPDWYEQTATLKHWAKDCKEFKPERWLVKDESGTTKILNPPPYELITFGAGPRLCIGKNVAILEAKTLTAQILQTFEIKIHPGYEPRQRMAPVWSMPEGLPVTAHLRK